MSKKDRLGYSLLNRVSRLVHPSTNAVIQVISDCDPESYLPGEPLYLIETPYGVYHMAYKTNGFIIIGMLEGLPDDFPKEYIVKFGEVTPVGAAEAKKETFETEWERRSKDPRYEGYYFHPPESLVVRLGLVNLTFEERRALYASPGLYSALFESEKSIDFNCAMENSRTPTHRSMNSIPPKYGDGILMDLIDEIITRKDKINDVEVKTGWITKVLSNLKKRFRPL